MIRTRADAEDLTRRVIALSKAEGCVVWLEGYQTRNLRFASRGGGSNGASGSARLSITSIYGQKQGRASSDLLDTASLKDAVERSEAAAHASLDNDEVMPPLGPQVYPANAAYSAKTAKLSANELADLLREGVRQASQADVDLATYAQASGSWRAYATSAGAFGYDQTTSARLTLSARNRRGTWSGWAGIDHHDISGIDAAALAHTAIDKASAKLEPTSLEPGKYVVLLEPSVVAEFLGNMMGHFGARAADEGHSFLARKGGGNRLNEHLFDERITMTSDPADPIAPGTALSNDGLPNRPVTWIEAGVVKTLMRGRYWAQKSGMDAVPDPGFFTLHGTNSTVAELIREVKRGILVTRIWYVRMVDPRSLLLTGLTRDGTFLIEDGAISRPIVNFRFNESPLAVLKNVLAIGQSQPAHPTEVRGIFGVPPLLVKDFTFSSLSPAV